MSDIADLATQKLTPAPPKRKTAMYDAQNEAAARIILADPGRYEGTVAWVWAVRVVGILDA
ncbi:MAG: hypothetical protein LLG20_18745 [Acidobacteriales bacterium]|nr:hypothetical protein [Terriglobales bacterium]